MTWTVAGPTEELTESKDLFQTEADISPEYEEKKVDGSKRQTDKKKSAFWSRPHAEREF